MENEDFPDMFPTPTQSLGHSLALRWAYVAACFGDASVPLT